MFFRSVPCAFIVFAAVLLAAATAGAGEHIAYQGRLTESVGNPVADGSYTVTFGLYADSTGGSALWEETANVTTLAGLFNHLIGSQAELSSAVFADHATLFLGLTVGTETVTPRTRLASTPGAAVAANLRIVNDAGIVVGRAGADSGGVLALNDINGDTSIVLQGGLVGDSAVIFPESSLSAPEMLDEPGVASAKRTSLMDLSDGTMTDLVVIEIEIPSDGFIVLYGKCYALLSGTTGPNGAKVQIDDEEGGTALFPYYTRAGLSGFVNAGINYFPMFVTRVYYRPAGIHQFRLEGIATHSLPALAQTWDHILTAVYYPSSYGWVSLIAPTPDGHPEAIPIDLNGDRQPGRSGTVYDVDLRPDEDR